MSQIAAGFVVYRWLEQNLQFLLLQTSYGINHWTPPKGHVDPGETIQDAAFRETEEEAGLSKDDLRIVWDFRKELNYMVGTGTQKTVVFWLAEQIACSEETKSSSTSSTIGCTDTSTTKQCHLKEVRLSSEHQAYKWLSLVDACRWSVYSEMQQLLKEAEAYIRDKQKEQDQLHESDKWL